jgi:hypothetical protein
MQSVRLVQVGRNHPPINSPFLPLTGGETGGKLLPSCTSSPISGKKGLLVQCGRNNPPVKKGSNGYYKSFLPFCLVTERVEVRPPDWSLSVSKCCLLALVAPLTHTENRSVPELRSIRTCGHCWLGVAHPLWCPIIA